MSKAKDQIVSLPVVFKDSIFKSRTLVMPDGAALHVSDGVAKAETNEAIQFLTDHAEFERAPAVTE
ncbi:hypothetical protein ACPRNU_05440 [Chromobacterium vaccinii]|uniref:hypothetical protein n=1 Tax=Chromobacterium vaccinii TaxID=1108595 RepID=UPI003C715D4A